MKCCAGITTAILAAGLLLTGCELFGLSDGDDLESGTFDVRVEGDVEHAFQGEAVFDTLRDSRGELHFYLILNAAGEPDAPYRTVELLRSRHGRPDVGRYGVANFEKDGAVDPLEFKVRYWPEEYGIFSSSGGTLIIDAADEERLKGSFDLTAFHWTRDADGSPRKLEVRITGAFHAEQGDTGIDLD